MSEWRDIATAPKDGTPVLVKVTDDLTDCGSPSRFAGIFAIMRNRGDAMGWCFAGPVGIGGFEDADLDGWRPILGPPRP